MSAPAYCSMDSCFKPEKGYLVQSQYTEVRSTLHRALFQRYCALFYN